MKNEVCKYQGVIDTKKYIPTYGIYYGIHTFYYQRKIVIHKMFELFSKQMRLSGNK